MSTSNTITKTDLENIINAIFPATTEDMTQAQVDAFIASLNCQGGGTEEFTLTAYSGYDNYIAKGIYDKSSDTVRLYLWGYDSADISAGSTLFTIPSQYRPSTAVTAVAVICTDAVNGIPYFVTISTNGGITQTLTSHLRRILIIAEYKLG